MYCRRKRYQSIIGEKNRSKKESSSTRERRFKSGEDDFSLDKEIHTKTNSMYNINVYDKFCIRALGRNYGMWYAFHLEW